MTKEEYAEELDNKLGQVCGIMRHGGSNRLIDAGVANQMLIQGYEIDDVPTVDAQLVRHGRWIKHRIYDPKSILHGAVKDTTCSVCGKSTPYNTEYCQNCGARMDGDGEWEETQGDYVELYRLSDLGKSGADWFQRGEEYVCNHCGCSAPMDINRKHTVTTKFCPHCGYKMGG